MQEQELNKSIVTSYRLSQDTKDKLQQQLKDLGLTQEAYFNRVVSIMELESAKKNSLLSKDTTIVQSNLDAILNAFISIADSSNNLISNKDIELQEGKEKYKNTLADKENVLQQQKQELQDVYGIVEVVQTKNRELEEEFKSIKSDYDSQIGQLQDGLHDKNSLVDEYKSKNDTLTGLLTKYEKYPDEIETVKGLLSDAQARNIELKDNLKELESNNKEHMVLLDKLKVEHQRELQTIKDLEIIAKDKAILKLQAEHQQAMEQISNKHNLDISEYQDKYKALLQELEQSRKAKPQARETKSNKDIAK